MKEFLAESDRLGFGVNRAIKMARGEKGKARAPFISCDPPAMKQGGVVLQSMINTRKFARIVERL